MKRIKQKFQELKKGKRCALVTYICSGDPDFQTSLQTLKAMPDAGADIIELGVPFLDPSGDGPVIESASKQSIKSGMTLKKTLEMASEFRKDDQKTPLILMSYYNPIFKFGLNKIFAESEKSGIDGLLIVDLPVEEEQEIMKEISSTKLDLIRLIAPTTDEKRAKKIIKNAGGFLYLISMLGTTGTKLTNQNLVWNQLKNLKSISNLPIAVGFGIQTPNQAKEFSDKGADAVVIGSIIVKEMAEKKSSFQITNSVVKKIQDFSKNLERGSNNDKKYN